MLFGTSIFLLSHRTKIVRKQLYFNTGQKLPESKFTLTPDKMSESNFTLKPDKNCQKAFLL